MRSALFKYSAKWLLCLSISLISWMSCNLLSHFNLSFSCIFKSLFLSSHSVNFSPFGTLTIANYFSRVNIFLTPNAKYFSFKGSDSLLTFYLFIYDVSFLFPYFPLHPESFFYFFALLFAFFQT